MEMKEITESSKYNVDSSKDDELVMESSISVDDSEYIAANKGKSPQGTGSWAFGIGKKDNVIFLHNTTYNDAVKLAKKVAERQNVPIIFTKS